MGILGIKNLGIKFGGLVAVDRFQLEMETHELIGLIGPNGAGKTTVFNMLTGVYKPTEGKIVLDGANLVGKKTDQIARMGVARTFQNIRLFSEMTVEENVKIALGNFYNYTFLECVSKSKRFRSQEKEMEEEALELLKVFSLEQYAGTKAGNLPYGKQRELEIVRALALKPKLLLLDEPAAGMNPQETENLMKIIRYIKDEFHLTILLIEHDMKLVMGICERIVVLNFGTTLAEGTPEEILNNPEVVKAYLGG